MNRASSCLLLFLSFACAGAHAQLSATLTVQRTVSIPPNGGSHADVAVDCPAGYAALAGGLDNIWFNSFEITTLAPTFNGAGLILQGDGAHAAATGWYASVINYDSAPHPATVVAVCAPVSGVVVVVGSIAVTAMDSGGPGGASLAVQCPSGMVATSGGIDVSRPEAIKVTSNSPWFSTGAAYLTNRTAGIHPAPAGWTGAVTNQGTSAGTMKVAAICAGLAKVVTLVSDALAIQVADNNGTGMICPGGSIAVGGGFDSTDLQALIGTASAPIYTGVAYPADRGDGQYPAPLGWFSDTYSHAASGTPKLTTAAICAEVAVAPAGSTVTVYEFYNTNLKHYFRTSSSTEATAIDNGSAGPGWIRTGDNFTAYVAGGTGAGADVCRFYTFGANSHFYTAFADECAGLKSPTSGWNYEGLSYRIQLPENATCAVGTVPVYRLYNNRFAFNDSNHRFTIGLASVAPLQAQGWNYEGVAFCALNY